MGLRTKQPNVFRDATLLTKEARPNSPLSSVTIIAAPVATTTHIPTRRYINDWSKHKIGIPCDACARFVEYRYISHCPLDRRHENSNRSSPCVRHYEFPIYYRRERNNKCAIRRFISRRADGMASATPAHVLLLTKVSRCAVPSIRRSPRPEKGPPIPLLGSFTLRRLFYLTRVVVGCFAHRAFEGIRTGSVWNLPQLFDRNG